MVVKKIKYGPNQKLIRIPIGHNNLVLDYYERLKNVFSEGFLASPGQNDLRNWSDHNTREINWHIDSESPKPAGTINDEIRELLDQEKDKLQAKILELKKLTENQNNLEEKEFLFICNHFSFNWENPEGLVYKTESGISILGWGLTDVGGKIIPFLPDTQEPEEEVVEEPSPSIVTGKKENLKDYEMPFKSRHRKITSNVN